MTKAKISYGDFGGAHMMGSSSFGTQLAVSFMKAILISCILSGNLAISSEDLPHHVPWPVVELSKSGFLIHRNLSCPMNNCKPMIAKTAKKNNVNNMTSDKFFRDFSSELTMIRKPRGKVIKKFVLETLMNSCLYLIYSTMIL